MKIDFEASTPLTEDFFFKPNKKYFRWMGMWPEDNIFQWKNLVLASFAFVIIMIIGMAQCAYSVHNFYDDLHSSLEVICATCCVWVTFLKLFVLFCLRRRLKIIILHLRKAWLNSK